MKYILKKKMIVDIVICKLGWSIFLRQYGGVTKWVNRNKKRGKKQIFRVQKRMVISFVHRAGGCCSGAFQSSSARFWLDCSQLEWAIYTEGQWWYKLPRYKYILFGFWPDCSELRCRVPAESSWVMIPNWSGVNSP